MSGNDLKSLPGEFDKMKAAEYLNFSDNIIESLPESICKLASIRELDVSDNKYDEREGRHRMNEIEKKKVDYCVDFY